MVADKNHVGLTASTIVTLVTRKIGTFGHFSLSTGSIPSRFAKWNLIMPVTPAQLAKPIDPAKPAFKKMLSMLQGNILKGHGRDNTRNLFLTFDPARKAQARAALRNLAPAITRASDQLSQVGRFKAFGVSGGTSVFLFLSAAGYKALGVAASKTPADPNFRSGMKASQAALADPATSAWDSPFRSELHAMLLIADECAANIAKAEASLSSQLALAGINVIGAETGIAQRNKANEGIEHFGYVDGRSQPLMLKGDVDAEKAAAGGSFQWDPSMGPGPMALVRDPGSDDPDAFGSYFVFRKLEQNVKGFKKREDDLATALGFTGNARELAGALIVGRFENGFPVIDAKTTSGHPPVSNNFTYATDPNAHKCPFASHIRKTNPRGDTAREFGVPEGDERLHLMPRRGITYGTRTDDFETESQFPTGGVGLLFMAYNAEIARQFEFTQGSWANNPNFVKPGTGPDPVIGQGPAAPNQWPTLWGNSASPKVSFTFGQFVTMKGGEYFFAPSLATIEAL